MKTAIKKTARKTRRLETDGFATLGRRRVLSKTGTSQVAFKREDLNLLNQVGREITRKTGLAVSPRQIVVHLATKFMQDRV